MTANLFNCNLSVPIKITVMYIDGQSAIIGNFYTISSMGSKSIFGSYVGSIVSGQVSSVNGTISFALNTNLKTWSVYLGATQDIYQTYTFSVFDGTNTASVSFYIRDDAF